MPFRLMHPGRLTANVIPLGTLDPNIFDVLVEFPAGSRLGQHEAIELIVDTRDADYWRFMVAGIAELNQRWSSTLPENRATLRAAE